MAESLTLTLHNDLGELVRVQSHVAAFLAGAGASADTLYLTRLAIEELTSNVIRHGYEHVGQHIYITIAPRPDAVDVVIEDDGRPFDPGSQSDRAAPASLDEAPTGGMGIGLVRGLVGATHYDRVDGRNRVTCRVPR